MFRVVGFDAARRLSTLSLSISLSRCVSVPRPIGVASMPSLRGQSDALSNAATGKPDSECRISQAFLADGRAVFPAMGTQSERCNRVGSRNSSARCSLSPRILYPNDRRYDYYYYVPSACSPRRLSRCIRTSIQPAPFHERGRSNRVSFVLEYFRAQLSFTGRLFTFPRGSGRKKLRKYFSTGNLVAARRSNRPGECSGH